MAPADVSAQGCPIPAEPSLSAVSAFRAALTSDSPVVPAPLSALVEENIAVSRGLATVVEENGAVLSRITANVQAEVPQTVREAEATVAESVPVPPQGNDAVVARDLAAAVEANTATLSRIGADVASRVAAPVQIEVPSTVPGGEPLRGEMAPPSVPESVPALLQGNAVVARDLAAAVEANVATLSRIGTDAASRVVGAVQVKVPEAAPGGEALRGKVAPSSVSESVPALLQGNAAVARDLTRAVESNTATLTRIAVSIPLETAVAVNAALGEALAVARPLEMPEVARPERVVAEEEPHEEPGAETEIVAQAVPFVVPQMVAPQVPDAPDVRVQPVDVAAVKAAELPPAQMLVEAAGAVAETLLVTPGLLSGQGEVVIQLRPDVLDGTDLRVAVTGRELQVVFEPRTVDMSVLIENCRPQLVEHLAARIHAFNVAVLVRPNVSAGRGARVRDEETI